MINLSTKQFIAEHISDDWSKLAFSANRNTDVDVLQAINQIKGRRLIEQKIPTWYENADIVFPAHLSLEQCSSETTASFKSTLIQGNTLVDLTGGFGVDCAFLSSQFKQVTYVERNAELCEIAKHNFAVLGLNHIQVINADAVDYLQQMPSVDCIFIDPARRDGVGRKTVALSDCEPNVVEILPTLLEKSKTVLLKLSPMLDIRLALSDLKKVAGVSVISVDNECKELLLMLSNQANGNPLISCLNFRKNNELQTFSFTNEEEQLANVSYAHLPEKYLYEPNASILKAGAYKLLSSRLGLKKLHPNSHLYTSDTLFADFPGRIFSIDSYFSLNKRDMREYLGGIIQANITVRNFPDTVASLRKKTKLAEGGQVYLFATTLLDEKKVLVKCSKC
jgi:16S rRNA G966 N2-methylase RsmD